MTALLCLLLLFFSALYLLSAFSCVEEKSENEERVPSRQDYLSDDLELDFATGKVDKEEYDRLRASLNN